MKAAHVQARLGKRGDMRCQPSCPGWVVRTSPGKPRIMACTACNAYHLPRLQVTDAMVKLLPLAREGLAAVIRTLARQKAERAVTRHAPTTNDATSAALCGHAIGRTASGRRMHVVAFRVGGANCAECLRLAAMTPAQRDQERQDRSEALAAKFKTKKDAALKEREVRDSDTAAQIAVARDDARVALDIMEVFDFDREKLSRLVLDPEPTVAERARVQMDLVHQALATAITAYRHANKKSRGDRRWVFRPADGRLQSRREANVRCRFCDIVLVSDGVIGEDYTATTDDHTVRCALEYLAGKLPVTETEMEES